MHRDACRALGYHGPFHGGQVDLTTVAGEEYITFSASYIPPSEEKIRRVGLATRAFPGSHTAVDVECWIEKVGLGSLHVFTIGNKYTCIPMYLLMCFFKLLFSYIVCSSSGFRS